MTTRGTTLLETLVALLATAIVLAGLAGTVGAVRTARAHAAATADRMGAARTALLRLTAEIEAAPTLEIVPPAPSATLDAPVLRLGDAPGGIVEWAVGADAALTRAERDCARPGPGLPIVAGLRAFRLRAFDGRAWRPAWAGGPLPRAVEITLGLDDGAGGVGELRTVATPPAARAGA